MEFTFTEEQTLLRDTVDRFVRDALPFEKRQAIIDHYPGYSDDHWHTLAELGVLALPVSEDSGGLGGGGVETMLVMEQMGKSLLPSPYVPSILLGASILDRLANSDMQKEVLESVVGGEKKLAFAYAERGAGFSISNVSTMAITNNNGFMITGEKSTVLHADTADYFIVLARTSGNQHEKHGLSLFLVPNADDVEMQSYPTQDGNRASELMFAGVLVGPEALLGNAGEACAIVEEVLD
ncbi:MAG: pimeloyl-CoA dehydrogenase small subunit, partial [Rhodospirillales bacterium]|nr:pimeloyl-CoA dehydrogenase small subunit [Rhodospirillales bacterium]